MRQNKSQSGDSYPAAKDLPVHVVEQIIENQKQQIILKSQEYKLREKEIEINANLAKTEIGHQAEIMKARPRETRKTFQVVAGFIIMLVIIILVFFGYCVYTGHEDFALKIFGYFMYVVTTVGGYYAGRRSKKGSFSKTDITEDAEIITE